MQVRIFPVKVCGPVCECLLGALGATTACGQGFHSTTGIVGRFCKD